MARFIILWDQNTDRSDPHWTGFPTWQTVDEDVEKMQTLIDVPDNTLPANPHSPKQLADHWAMFYPDHAHKFVTELPPDG